jgi:signal transduction histidine kinase
MSSPRPAVLIVDDIDANLVAMEATLAALDCEVVRATSGSAALKQLLRREFALMLLDVQMPGMDGCEVARYVRGHPATANLPIIFITAAHPNDEQAIRGYALGAVDFVFKPVNPVVLRSKVHVFLKLHDHHERLSEEIESHKRTAVQLQRSSEALLDLNEKLEARVSERTMELTRSEAALQEAARQKDAFLATLAHELRNPLSPLSTGLDLLLHTLGGAPTFEDKTQLVQKALGAMDRQLRHMVRLIDDLFDLSRISRGMLELKTEHTDIAEIVHRAVETGRPTFERRGQSLTVDATCSAVAEVDPTRVFQIISNLLNNASKYTQDGGAASVRLAIEGDRLAVVRVVDSGMGLAPDQLERIFEMFVRVDHTAPGGLGIGLALARRLARAQGGTLTAMSTGIGEGSTFTLSLPLSVEPARAVVAPRATLKPRSSECASRDVVVIEDNEDVADTLALLLAEMGHRVAVARGGAEGVDLVKSRRPAVVLCDLGLPGMDGVEVCRRVLHLSVGYHPLMVALTGWGQEDDRKRTRQAGFDHHLVKPVRPETLVDIFRSAASIGHVRSV